MPSTAHGACGSTSNQSVIAAQARAIAVSDAVTSSSPLVKCSAGSSRIRSKISRRSDVPSASDAERAVLRGQGLDLGQPDVVDLLGA